MKPASRQKGFTLIETIIVIVMLGAMLAGMTVLFVQNINDSHRPYLRQRALAVANSYMDEILRKRWDENTPIGGGCVDTGTTCVGTGPAENGIGTEGETRVQYDDIDDYDEITNQTPPQDASGTDMPGYTGFSVSVTVSKPAGGWGAIPQADVKLITVDVTSSSGETIGLSAYRVNL